MTEDAKTPGTEDDEHNEGGHHHAGPETLGVALLTISSSRSLDEDTAGDAAVALLEDAGHDVVTRDLVPDDHDRIQGHVDTLAGRDDVDIVVTSGGTGVTPDDVTVEAVEPILERELPGFGEVFRSMSREEVGTRAIHSRATAGITDGIPVFVLPGSENAVRLAIAELVIPEGPHLVAMATRGT